MAKTEETIKLEREIWKATAKQGTFGCFEVTIGWYGRERVDYITFDTKGIWRCYEIKVSKSDFRSTASNTFIGNFNFYVLTAELYKKVKEEIPPHIGVYVNGVCVKRAKKQKLLADVQVLKDSLIRSLYREVDKQVRSGDPALIAQRDRTIRRLEVEKNEAKRKFWDLQDEVREKYGTRWNKEK